MSKISERDKVSILVTDYGDWPCPAELMTLHEKARRAGIEFWRDPWDPGLSDAALCVPSQRTPEGKAYYAREREYVKAIDLIESTGELCVMAREPSPEARERELQMEST